MNSTTNIYGTRSNGVQHGDVFTKPCVVRYMLDLVGYTSDRDLSHISISEPSCGEGEFIIEIIRRLAESAQRFGFDLNDAYHSMVSASDIDENKILVCIERIKTEFPEINYPGSRIFAEDYLLTSHEPVDIVVGNPPYIRYEQIPENKLSIYRHHFSTFYYRADMYVLFFEKSLRQLKPGGQHCFICSNRWMKNTYGKVLRGMVATNYSIDRIVNMEGADAFDEEVLAYPAITLIKAQRSSGITLYTETTSVEELPTLQMESLDAPTNDDWLKMFISDSVLNDLPLIEAQGFKIGVGVATGADKIFVSKELKGLVEDEVLLPAINGKDLQGNNMEWGELYLLNPYDSNGRLIRLDDYPMTKAYLESHRERLANRHKAKKNVANWYATIDKIQAPLTWQAKILLPDISGNTFIFVDEGHFYPQHNIYYITGGSLQDLKLLSSLLMSDSVRKQLNKMTNKMNGGYARWQSQYLRRLHVPLLSEIPDNLASDILTCYNEKNIEGINYYASEIFNHYLTRGNDASKVDVKKETYKQLDFLDLFDMYDFEPITQNISVQDDSQIESEERTSPLGSLIDPNKKLLISNVKKDNFEQFLDGTATIYYTGKKFPSTVALNKLYYFMPYLSGKGIRDLYYIKIARLGYRKEGQKNEDKNDLRLVFEIERVCQIFDDYKKVKLEIWRTFTDTTMEQILSLK